MHLLTVQGEAYSPGYTHQEVPRDIYHPGTPLYLPGVHLSAHPGYTSLPATGYTSLPTTEVPSLLPGTVFGPATGGEVLLPALRDECYFMYF